MPSLLNRSGVWYATFHDSDRRPKQRRLSLKTKSKRTAERLLARLDDAYREGRWDAWTQRPEELLHEGRPAEPKRLGDAVAAFLEAKRPYIRESTLRSYRSHLRQLVSSVGADTYLPRIDSGGVERSVGEVGLNGEPASTGTKRQRLTVFKSFFGWSEAERLVAKSPAASVSRPKEDERLPRAVTDEELDAVLGAVPEGRAWARAAFEFAALTGLRISELARLRWRDVDAERRLIRIEQQKSGKAQTQPISRSAADLLRSVPRRGEYVFTSPNATSSERNVFSWCAQMQRTFRDARTAAKIGRPITPHGLRHRYCTKLAESGANAFVIQRAARHADIETSQRYVSISNQKLRAELDEVFG